MGISSDGQICYGIAFEEDYQFPWMDEDGDHDENEWWIEDVCGYKPPFEIYNEHGEYKDGIKPTKEKSDEYYKHRREFELSHPMPVEIVSHCSYDYTMYIIAANGTELRASRGYPMAFTALEVDKEKVQAVIDFCEKYCKPKDEYCEFPKMEPAWLLSSMYG